MSALEHKVSRSRRWQAWAGDLEDLMKLGRTLEEAAHQLDPDWPGISATVVEGTDHISGPIGDVVSSIDRRSASSVSFAVASEMRHLYDFLSATVGKEGYQQGASVNVSSSNTAWARQTFARLSEEVEKGVPRWALLRTPWGRRLVGVAGGLAMFSALALALAGLTRVAVVYPASAGAGLATAWLLTRRRTIDWLFPAFEILGPGGTSTGSRRLATLISLAASVVVGIIVNLMT